MSTVSPSRDDDVRCRVCGGSCNPAGDKIGAWRNERYSFAACTRCGFRFVINPSRDFDAIYNEDYYRGKGADPLVDYENELSSPSKTIRRYEWRGIERIVRSVTPLSAGSRWLDYGCGAGGLVRFLRSTHGIAAEGYDHGGFVPVSQEAGIDVYDDHERLVQNAGKFDVVTAIEVLEHSLDPVATLTEIQSLLKPGGLLFYTTGNATPVDDFVKWSYVLPEIHVSYFSERSIATALQRAGLDPLSVPFSAGYADIIRFKILKNLGARSINPYFNALPWNAITRFVDSRYRITQMPIGRKPLAL